ncbi:hypothetical protein SPHINGOT1_10124 [Sphingomonas sp. T1]|nr:hypothetical protein SPHINGOT1_10124 [Sphingomonas sp. T1]
MRCAFDRRGRGTLSEAVPVLVGPGSLRRERDFEHAGPSGGNVRTKSLHRWQSSAPLAVCGRPGGYPGMSGIAARGSGVAALIGFDDAADDRVADDVADGEAAHRDALDPLQTADRIGQTRGGDAAGDVDLLGIAADHHPAVLAEAGEEHLHLRGRRILRLVEDHERVGQRPAAHEGDRCDLDLAARDAAFDLLGGEAVVERIVQGTEIGVDLLLHVAGKEAQPLARLDRGARQDQTLDAAGDELLDRLRDRDIGLAGACWSEREDHVVVRQLAHVVRLRRRARNDRLLARADHDRGGSAAAGIGADDPFEHGFVGHRDRGVDEAGVDILAALDPGIEIVEHVARLGDLFRGALQTNLVAARGDVHTKAVFERYQILVVLAEEPDEELGLVEQQLDSGAVTGLGGNGFTAHAVLSGADVSDR